MDREWEMREEKEKTTEEISQEKDIEEKKKESKMGKKKGDTHALNITKGSKRQQRREKMNKETFWKV